MDLATPDAREAVMREDGYDGETGKKVDGMKVRLSPNEASLLTPDQKVARAIAALKEIGEEANQLPGSALADEIDRRTGVGFEAAAIVVLSSGH
jgi:hypothetical protein